VEGMTADRTEVPEVGIFNAYPFFKTGGAYGRKIKEFVSQ